MINPLGQQIATYWKNGVANSVADNVNYSEGTSIAVSGQDVYMSGFLSERTAFFTIPVVWKNGVTTKIVDSIGGISTIRQPFAKTVVSNGTDIYVSGPFRDNLAAYWKNGKLVPFTNDQRSIGYNILLVQK